jgi:WD40-like Beta Propeller Repeat
MAESRKRFSWRLRVVISDNMRMVRVVLAAVTALFALSAPADAQFFAFGQNKIQYRKLQWRIIRGPHVDLYYYPAEAELAPAALAYAEASYDTLSKQFGHDVAARIPLIVYASHTDFEQTNILPFTPPEGLLGVTDFLKRRVALPFRGNFAEFRHTLRHEMVHVFQLDLQSESYHMAPRSGRFNFPLWWSEGLAELWSGGEDARDNMVLRDLTFSGQLPQFKQLTYVVGGIVYPLGGRIHRWLADTYGDWRVPLMYKELNRYDTFEDAIQATYGRSLDELSEEFQLALRRTYYPIAESLAPLSVLGHEVSRLAIKPAFLPDTAAEAGGDADAGEVVYLSPEGGYVSIYRRKLGGGKPHRVVVAGRTAALEAFHAFDSRTDASRPGFLLFAARYGDRDALVVWDLKRSKVVGRYQFDRLVSILSPMWMPDGGSIVFSGLSESGVSDLYRVRLPKGTLEPLTRDRFQDLNPSPSRDGRQIVFASDRAAGGLDGTVNLFLLDIRSGAISQLTRGRWVDEAPTWGPDGRVYFTSDRDGVLNVFSMDTTGEGRRETSAWSGAFDPVPLPDGSGMLVGGFHDLSWNLYRYPVDLAARQDRFTTDSGPAAGQWAWANSRGTAAGTASGTASDKPYRGRLTLDFAFGDAVFVPGYGGAQGVAFLMSDLLGDNLVFGSIGSTHGRGIGSVFENISASAVYLNRSRRLNWGLGAFRTKSRNYEGDNVVAYNETAYGAIGLLRYPLSRFNRIEGTMVMEHSNRFDFTLDVDEPRRVGWIATHYLSYVHDNAIWINSGPIDGARFSVLGGLSNDFTNARFDSYFLSADWRKYLRMGSRSGYAVRAFGFYSGGDRPRRTNIGGTLGLRGYPQYGYILGSQVFMLNQEIRFPVLNHLTLGTPVGDIRFPEVQAAPFLDLGHATSPSAHRAMLGSFGLSLRLAAAAFAVLRLDMGRRFSDDNFRGYSLNREQRDGGFVSFYFGYNY